MAGITFPSTINGVYNKYVFEEKNSTSLNMKALVATSINTNL